MSTFSIDKQRLVDIVDACQNRNFAEEIDSLNDLYNDPNEAILKGISIII